MKNKQKKAFSLIEIVISLGVLAFTLSAMIGLLCLALQSSQDSTEETIIAVMMNDVINDFRKTPFTRLPGAEDKSHSNSPINITAPVIIFDQRGQRLKSNFVNKIINPSFYQCTPYISVDTETLGRQNTQLQGEVNCLHVQLKFEWPVNSSKKQTKTIYFSVARYE